MKKITTLLMTLAVFFSCEMNYQNPIDPEAGNFQGFTVVNSIDDIEAMEDGHGDSYFLPVLWASKVNGAQSYEFQVFEAYNFSFDETVRLADFPLQSENNISLDEFRDRISPMAYEWRVRAYDGNGPGPWAESESTFYIQRIYGTDVSPLDGGGHAPGNVVNFEFPSIPGVSLYEFREATTPEGLSTAQVHPVSRTPPMSGFNLLDGETRYWQVRPVHDDGRKGFWSDAFTVIGQSELQTSFSIGIYPETPDNGAMVYDDDLTLRWAIDVNSEYASQITGYNIQYRVNNADLTDVSYMGSANASWWFPADDPAMDPGNTVYWRVQAITGSNEYSVWSDTYSFLTPAALSLQQGFSPAAAQDVQDTTPDISWSTAESFDSYHFRYTTVGESTLENGTSHETLSSSSHTIPAANLNYGDTVYWQVRGVNNDGSMSGWSGVNRFNVSWNIDWNNLAINPPHMPTNTTKDVLTHVDWSDVQGAHSYRVDFRTHNSNWSIPSSTSRAPVYADSNITIVDVEYFWRIIPFDIDGGEGPPSPEFVFQRRAPQLGDQLYGGYVVSVSPVEALVVGSIPTAPNDDPYYWYDGTSLVDSWVINTYGDWMLPTRDQVSALWGYTGGNSHTVLTNIGYVVDRTYWTSEPAGTPGVVYSYVDSGSLTFSGNSTATQHFLIPFRTQEYSR